MNIELQKFNFINIVPKLSEMFTALDSNRARLEPWFWWASADKTPTKMSFALFMIGYLLDTKRKALINMFNQKSLYDEQFIVVVDSKFSGMIGLDNIDSVKKEAELWGFVFKGSKPFVVADESLKILESYCINDKRLKSLYAFTQVENRAVEVAAKRNNYRIKKIELNVPTSARNPKITDLITWEKKLVK